LRIYLYIRVIKTKQYPVWISVNCPPNYPYNCLVGKPAIKAPPRSLFYVLKDHLRTLLSKLATVLATVFDNLEYSRCGKLLDGLTLNQSNCHLIFEFLSLCRILFKIPTPMKGLLVYFFPNLRSFILSRIRSRLLIPPC
jgi:hypothetical protein